MWTAFKVLQSMDCKYAVCGPASFDHRRRGGGLCMARVEKRKLLYKKALLIA